jgi:hypothetical protein
MAHAVACLCHYSEKLPHSPSTLVRLGHFVPSLTICSVQAALSPSLPLDSLRSLGVARDKPSIPSICLDGLGTSLSGQALRGTQDKPLSVLKNGGDMIPDIKHLSHIKRLLI